MTRFIWILALVVAPLTGCGGGGATSAGGAGGAGGDGGAGGAPSCSGNEDCDDGNPCTDNVCNEAERCEHPPTSDGAVCPDGTCVVGSCEAVESAFPCTEQGLLDAVAAGGGPYGFSCDGPQTVVMSVELVAEADVILDGLGKLTVDGGGQHRLLTIRDNVTAELRRFELTGGIASEGSGGAVVNSGILTIDDTTVSGNGASIFGGGIANFGTMTIAGCTVSGNVAEDDGGGVMNTGMLMMVSSTVSGNTTGAGSDGGGLMNTGSMTLASSTVSGNSAAGDAGGVANFNVLMLMNSTVSGNEAGGQGGGIWNNSVMTITSSTIARNTGTAGSGIGNAGVVMTVSNTLVAGECSGAALNSDGYNLESEGDSCGFDQPSDAVGVSVEALALGPLEDHGGPTQTHALATDSVAVDAIPASMCQVDEDQRGVARPQGSSCDTGAFELMP